MNKDIKVLVDKALGNGWTLKERKKGGHPVLYPTDRRFSPVAVPFSPSEYKGVANFKSELRKRGLPV